MVDEFSSKYPDARFSMETERRRPRTPFSQPSPPPSSEAQLDLEKWLQVLCQQAKEKYAKASCMTAGSFRHYEGRCYERVVFWTWVFWIHPIWLPTWKKTIWRKIISMSVEWMCLPLVSTKGALRLPTAYDNHPIQPILSRPSTYSCEDTLSTEEVI